MITVYTIGHSNHPLEKFIALLREHGIEVVVDVRSQPYSRYVPHFNRQNLARELAAQGFTYIFMGDKLGGHPLEGTPPLTYKELESGDHYRQGLEDLLSLAAERRTAIMCGEGNYRHCHRHKLITPNLLARGARVLHIQPDGSLVDAAEEPRQLALF